MSFFAKIQKNTFISFLIIGIIGISSTVFYLYSFQVVQNTWEVCNLYFMNYYLKESSEIFQGKFNHSSSSTYIFNANNFPPSLLSRFCLPCPQFSTFRLLTMFCWVAIAARPPPKKQPRGGASPQPHSESASAAAWRMNLKRFKFLLFSQLKINFAPGAHVSHGFKFDCFCLFSSISCCSSFSIWFSN